MDNKFGELIATKRKQLGYSVRRVAELVSKSVKVSPTHIINLETGKVQQPGLALVDALAEVLNIPQEEARLAAKHHVPLSVQDEIVVELAANLREIPEEVQRILQTQIRAVHDLFAAKQKEDNGKGGKSKKKPPSKGVKPGDPEYREPSGTLTPPPRKKKDEEGEAPQEKQGRRSA